MKHLYLIYHFIFTFFISLISTNFLIKIFTKHKFIQPNRIILEEITGKKAHISMGGIAILFALNLSFIFLYCLGYKANFSVILLGNAFGLLGLTDDILKVQNQSGLLIRQRLIYEIICALIFVFYINTIDNSRCYIPILNNLFNVQFLNILWGVFIILGTANAYNLTDGVDSLVSTLAIYALIFLAIFGLESVILCLLLIAAILGYLVYNWPPAKIIMGDVGSLSIGAITGALFYKYHLELFLPLIGIIFVIETLSSAIQIYYIRALNKRLFLMAPLHHHLEKKGWSKKKILIVFNLTGLLALIIGFIIKLWF